MKEGHRTRWKSIWRQASFCSSGLGRGIRRSFTVYTYRDYRSGYPPCGNSIQASQLDDNDSFTREESRNKNSFYVALDTLRHIRYLSVKTPIELSQEMQSFSESCDEPPTVVSSHGLYAPRPVSEPPDPGYIRASLFCWRNGHLKELGLYDDIPVYPGGRLPCGRIHFGMTRELWQLPNLAVIDPSELMYYEIREPFSLTRDELDPFLHHGVYLPVIDCPSPGLVNVRLIRLYSKKKARQCKLLLRQGSIRLNSMFKHSLHNLSTA
ncbi:hypothetical protein BC835DRAFT_1378999 [Cytidiella melzeri]|nr:hypothetical protein BC835DRAFT_1378999 [Cytidiella melzeri]